MMLLLYEHTQLTMYYIRPLLYHIVIVSLWFSHGFSTKYIGYNANYIGAVTQSNVMGTFTYIVTNTVCSVTVTKL